MIFKNEFLNRIAIYDNNKQYSYRDLKKHSDHFKNIINKDSLVFFLASNNISSLKIYLSLMQNCSFLILDSMLQTDKILNLINQYKPNYIFKPRNIKIKLNLFSCQWKDENYLLFKCKKFNKFKINKKIKLIIPTSGSSGDPKCVKLSKDNLINNAKSIKKYLDIDQNDKALTTLPMSYSYGISVLNSHFFFGASIIINKFSILQKEFWNNPNLDKVTNLNGVPYFFEMLDKIKFKNLFILKSLKFITQAGGELNKKNFFDLKNFCKKNSIKFFTMYGQTEASPRISYCEITHKKNLYLNIPSIGKTIPEGQILIKGKKRITKPYSIGEIIYKGKNIFKGYSYNFKDLKNIKNYKILNTGDLGYFDNKKNFFITGRKTREIKIYGYRVNLDILEKEIYKVNNLSEIGIIFKDKKIYIFSNKKIKTFKYLFSNSMVNIVIRKLPRTKNNKIDYNKLHSIIYEKK